VMSEGSRLLKTIDVEGEGRFLAADWLGRDALSLILKAHRETRDPARVLKRNLGTVVTRVPLFQPPSSSAPERSSSRPNEVVVKETPTPWRRRAGAFLGARSPYLREFAKAQRLEELGFLVARPLAATVSTFRAREFLVTELVEDGVSLRELLWLGDRVIQDPSERALLLSEVGRWLRGLHERGVWQRDMKPANLLVRRREGSGAEIFLVDITRVRCQGAPLGNRRRLRNLGQLLDLPKSLDIVARDPLLKAYLLNDQASIDGWAEDVSKAVESRRANRKKECGLLYPDEEHFSHR